jgi:tetratricopeptide (TPR) repeat protein
MTSSIDHGSLLGSIAEYTELLARNPRDTVFIQLSEAYRQLGLADEALDIARSGVQNLPAFTPGHTLLGQLLAERGDMAGAIVSFEKALGIDADCFPALKGLARIRYQQGEREAARQLLQRAATLQPGDPVVAKVLASLPPQAADASPDPVVAESPAEKKGGPPIATPTIAEIYERQGLLKRALGVYSDLLQLDPANQDLLRKYRDLKARISSGASGAAVSSPAAEEPERVEVHSPPGVLQEVQPGLRAIQSLERLLHAVRRRREHVQ